MKGFAWGYNPENKVYVLGVRRQQGIGVRVTDVRYVDEVTHRSRVSSFDRLDLEAFSAVQSPGTSYIAFIAIEGNDIALYVLNTGRDTIQKVGKAPLPPPLAQNERAYFNAHPEVLDPKQWNWMASFRDGYMELDPGIVEFEDNSSLRVSYGADTPYARAKERQIISIPLRVN